MSPPVVDLQVESYHRVGVPEPILQNVSWRVERGQHWVVLGSNGAGKSTLLSIVSGERWPSRGRVAVLGQTYGRCDKRELKKRIGVVSPALAVEFPRGDTAQEIAASGLDARVGNMGPPGAEALASARIALERVSASEIADKPFGVLSQGERQRTMIARALVAGPALLVLDEPCAGLDPVARERFLRDLTHLAAEAQEPTQVHVTHHLEEVPTFVTHALLLRRGRVSASGEVAEILTSERLSEALEVPCAVDQLRGEQGSRFRLKVLRC